MSGAPWERYQREEQERPGGPWERYAQPEEDVYHRTAREELAARRAKGAPPAVGLAGRFVQGRMLGGADEVLAGLNTVPEMIKRGTLNPVEGYRYAKAREDLELEEARETQGIAGSALEVGGNIMTGAGAARAGLTAARPGMGYADRVGAAVTDGLAYGGAQGALDAKDGERLQGAAQGATIGAGVGAGITGVLAPVARTVVAPIASHIQARANPQGAADRHLGRAIHESRRTPGAIAQGLDDAAADGQGGVYTLGDELGNPGQRMLSTIARTPGEGRTRVAEALDQRQAGQSRRVANTLAEGFNAPRTANQTRGDLEAARRQISDRNYGQARAQAAEPVDINPVLDAIDQNLTANPSRELGEVGLESTLRRIRGTLENADSGARREDFQSLFTLKRDLDIQIENASPTERRLLVPIRDALDNQLATSSQPYTNARDTHRAMSRPIDAIDQGTEAARSGRIEDNIDTFARLPDEASRQGFRAGYVDPMIARAQNQSVRANKTLPLQDEAFRAESARFAAPGRAPQMTRRLDREARMGDTFEQARMGSRTADNLADEAALEVNPEILLQMAAGNPGTAARNMIARISAASKGMTPEVRDRLAQLLLATPQNVTPQGLRSLVERVTREEAERQRIASALVRGASTGAVGANANR